MRPDFPKRVALITRWLQGRALTPELGQALREEFPPTSPEFQGLADLCLTGVWEGWLASRGQKPLKYGRVLKAGPETHGFSVDVVHMTDVAGPHHVHPKGEIDMIIPVNARADFDGRARGWLVYGPGSAHAPTVRFGSAVILYLLPGGEIEFSPDRG